jgi:hypothetical protein
MGDLAAREIYRKITTNIESVMRGQRAATRKLLAGFAGGGNFTNISAFSLFGPSNRENRRKSPLEC